MTTQDLRGVIDTLDAALRTAEGRIAALEGALAAETDQHEAFYTQHRHKCEALLGDRLSREHEDWHVIHEQGIASARALLSEPQEAKR